MSIDDDFAAPWERAEEYFQDEGFEETNFGIDAHGQGVDLEKALESLEGSTTGTIWLEREDIELTFSYNPAKQTGDIKVVKYSSDAEDDIERYVNELEETLGGDIEYGFGGEED